MHINFTPFTVLWSLLALVVVALAAYRKVVSTKEDETLHLGSAAAAVSAEQATVANKLEQIDHWGKMLTVVAVVTGLILAAAYTWQTWLSSNTPTGL
ncbi:MAG: hypothetical protein C5B51_11535 [Terriglobia bacterium]|nr:MAG: hypothetical protein C5B51_11535 [Terriglobia bacterium]